MSEQLVFELAAPEPPSFANFLPGRNVEAFAAVKALAAGTASETGMVLWGVEGAGKTHLLRAAAAAAGERGAAASYLAAPGALAAFDADALGRRDLVCVDALDGALPEAQGRLFTLFNRLRERGAHLLVASFVPPASLALRDDLRTRLGWGLVYELLPLADADKPLALAAYARQRGVRVGDDAIAYLLAHGRRDMAGLVATLAALDRQSLATKRPISVSLVRDWLQRNGGA